MPAYHEIRAVYDAETIRVYQAYNAVIAEEAVRLGTFGKHFKLGRMTWIKPSFLWMMYRCGWCSKPGQEHVLAIDLKRTAFEELLQKAVPSSYHESLGISYAQWQQQVQTSEVRVQWDPERDIFGNPLEYRSLQMGLRGKAVEQYVRDWIVRITDMTEDVQNWRRLRDAGEEILPLLPQEQIYPPKELNVYDEN